MQKASILGIVTLVFGCASAGPAAACGFDGMFGFSHYSEVAPDQAAADAMRDAAIAQARDNFMARHGMQQTADVGLTDAMASAAEAAIVATTNRADGAPQ